MCEDDPTRYDTLMRMPWQKVLAAADRKMHRLQEYVRHHQKK